MAFLPYLFGFVLLALGAYLLRQSLRQRRRARLLASSLTDEQRHIVAQLVPMTRRLPADLRAKLEGRIALFLDQITFHGRGGLEVSDPMRLSFAAQACLRIVNSDVWFDTLRTILVYPSAFRAQRPEHNGLTVHERHSTMLGESWTRGPVVLSWDHALQGGLDEHDGHNVVIHEFAHQLDALTGLTNGIPILSKGQRYEGWEEAMLEGFERHVERVHAGQATVIDPYGATNPQEYLAEAIVAFFERSYALRREEPALYAQLSELLALDPVAWS